MQYETDSNLVKKAIEHLLDIKRRENIRANQKKLNVQERNEKGYDKYNWEELTVKKVMLRSSNYRFCGNFASRASELIAKDDVFSEDNNFISSI